MPIVAYLDHLPQVAEDVFLAPTAFVVGRVTVGPGCNIWYGATVRGDTGQVTLGEAVSVQENSVVHTQDGEIPAIIGNRVTLGHGAVVHAATVEDDVLIGIGASILTRAKIGRFSIIAAHSLVPEGKEIPPYSLVMGVPGKVVRRVTEEEIERITRTAEHYRHRGQLYRRTET
jgi:carbonic anhydrase/acetyltransferase-like protein (isoleucine patch superfamily)